MEDPVLGPVFDDVSDLAVPQENYREPTTSARRSPRVALQDENTDPGSTVLPSESNGIYGQSTRSVDERTRGALLDARARLNAATGRTHPYRRHSRLRTVSHPTVGTISAAYTAVARVVSESVISHRSDASESVGLPRSVPPAAESSSTSSPQETGAAAEAIVARPPAVAAAAVVVAPVAFVGTVSGGSSSDQPTVPLRVDAAVQTQTHPTITIPAASVTSPVDLAAYPTITIPAASMASAVGAASGSTRAVLAPSIHSAASVPTNPTTTNPAPTVPSPAASLTDTVVETPPHVGVEGAGTKFVPVAQEITASQKLCTSSVRGHKVFQQALDELTYWESLLWLYTKVRKGEISELSLASERGEKAYAEAKQMTRAWHQNLALLEDALAGKLCADTDDTPSKSSGKKRDLGTALGDDNEDTHCNNRPRMA